MLLSVFVQILFRSADVCTGVTVLVRRRFRRHV